MYIGRYIIIWVYVNHFLKQEYWYYIYTDTSRFHTGPKLTHTNFMFLKFQVLYPTPTSQIYSYNKYHSGASRMVFIIGVDLYTYA